MYVILDLETTITMRYKRKANMFIDDNRIVASGLKYKGRPPETYYDQPIREGWLDGATIIVCHNASFDLLWMWKDPELRAFFKRGGKVWCTQFAEYLLSGQVRLYASLDEVSIRYGGHVKNDEIKEMWNAGIDTPDIPKDMIIDYLEGDVNNTEIVFLAQVAKARKLGMINTMKTHMEGLLCLIEMTHNGMYVDMRKALMQKRGLEEDLDIVLAKLKGFIPDDLPPEIVWNWGSKDHLSALFFGGKLKYKLHVHQKDENGVLLYTKATEQWPMLDKIPVAPGDRKDGDLYDTYLSGKKAGAIKYKNVAVQGKPKMKYEEFLHPVCQMYKPDKKWETKKEGVYKTDADILMLIENEVEAAKLMQTWRKIDKDLGTYYMRYDKKKDCDVGMLTLVMPDGIIHHKLNNVATITGRLSSSDPKQ